MEANCDSSPTGSAASNDALATILGYFNFSNGTPDAGVQRAFDVWWESLAVDVGWDGPRDQLLKRLTELQKSSPAFADCEQAEAVTRLIFDECLPAYRKHHADLLPHLDEDDLNQPLFVARVSEAVLSQGGPWDDRERIVVGAIDDLNDFLGYRPLPVLENGRKMQPYSRERFRPVPLYIRGVGVACGKYRALLERTLEFFRETPDDILREAHFDLSRMDELAMDVRAHDHSHPMNKRTNYMFGEWDPHVIDNKGYYRRFVVRRIILDLLLDWIEESDDASHEELLYDAAAALCGTMLMASAVSGYGPDAHDSDVTLTSLLPRIARQRDTFYVRLLADVGGERGERLRREAELTQQPFGHVRQQLNMRLAGFGARQVQYQHLAQLYARMGFPEESRQQAELIPAAATRFQCEINWRIASTHLEIERGQLQNVSQRINEVEDLLQRGIECGAIVDPWNILAFQELFPLFHSREDSIPDQRVEDLLDLMERLFGLFSAALGEAAAVGDADLASFLIEHFQALAERWDQYASTVVTALPHVSGHESFESACQVAQSLSEWRGAGEAAGDISFWRGKVDDFRAVKSYALVVNALLDRRDHVAAMGLLVQWLSEVETVGMENGPHSLYSMLLRWMKVVVAPEGERMDDADIWLAIRRMFDYLEANAGEYWSVPDLLIATGQASGGAAESANETNPLDEDDDEEQLFDAAYDNVTYRDSADDGHQGETMDEGFNADDTEIASITRIFEPRLKFLNTLSQLWQMAASALLTPAVTQSGKKPKPFKLDNEQIEVVASWAQQAERLEVNLSRQILAVWQYDVPFSADQINGDGEYGVQLQEKFDLLHAMIATLIGCQNAWRCLLCCLPDSASRTKDTESAVGDLQWVPMFRAVLRRDPAEARRLFPRLQKELAGRSLLYVPLENGGRPDEVRETRLLLSNLTFLLSQLPQVGLLRETWALLKTAFRMERSSRPGKGTAVTEFDRLFRVALHNSLECVIESVGKNNADDFSDDEMIEIIGEIVDPYLGLWLKHSSTTRLSSVEKLEEEDVWHDVKEFIADYGADLFHARMLLPPGKIRAILHHGVEHFLDELAEIQDPLHPFRLAEDLESGAVDRDYVIDCLELIYESLMDGLERFLEYKTTTTQSDYGEMFYCLLDFLRVEAAYERDAWNMAPVGIAHELLAGPEKTEAAVIWEKLFAERTGNKAERHLLQLQALEKQHGMRLPSVSDRLHERFVKPLAVNRMLALVAPAMQDARAGRSPSGSFAMLREEINAYMQSAVGSGLDIPDWMRSLEQIVGKEDRHAGTATYQSEADFRLPRVLLNRKEIRQQLKSWDDPVGKKKSTASRKRSAKKKGDGGSKGSTDSSAE
ncbi:MAG: hypothetical protein HOK71_16755 [Planctomycetaceae bacterium]|nr:hypothetical protein [Planctomycetaceae bacterium]MBT6486299.1 hypothetical protein [Planctomycetaceae bacterium]